MLMDRRMQHGRSLRAVVSSNTVTSNFVAEMFCLITECEEIRYSADQVLQLVSQCIYRHTQIQQRADKHITTDARKTIE